MKPLLLTIAFASLYGFSQAQNLGWARQTGGTDEDRTLTVFTDNQGTVYTGGHYKGKVDFDPGPDSFFREAPRGEAFILKSDAAGNFIGVITFGHTSGSYSCTVSAMRKDAAGDLYVSGYFNGTVDFDPDTSVQSIYVSGKHTFLLKLDAAEKYQWVKYWKYDKDAGETNEVGPAATWDASGNYYATGAFIGKVDFDPGTPAYNLTSKANEGYILKLDANGDFLWAKQLLTDSAIQEVTPLSIALDAANNMYIAGTFKGTVDFDPDSSAEYKMNAGIAHGFLLKLDANGGFVWAKKIGAEGDPFYDSHSCRYVSTDASGNSYITGSFCNTVAFGPMNLTSAGFSDIFVAKVDAAGNFLWAKQIGSFYDTEEGQRIVQDATGNVYVTGFYRGTVNFNTSGGIAQLTTNGSIDAFVLKLDPNGNFIWAKGLGGTGLGECVYHLSVTGNTVYTAGRFIGNLNCDPNGSYYMNSTYSGTGSDHYDGFLIKWNQGTTGVEELQALMANIFPNPATDQIHIELSSEPVSNMTVTVMDVQGKKIQQVTASKPFIQLSVKNLQRGVYFVKIQAKDRSTTKKLIIQ
ncbi:MAG TPA: T9SS type A sorting domain-containing protein [Flavipsychrobacter sp.]|nr:T9SS type A sorting domain-containing protein [Flavipsychrobacter sp.]